MDNKDFFESNPYRDTSDSMDNVVKTLPTYDEIMRAFEAGKNEIELKRRYMLKKLDEAWINVIEDCLPALDTIIRNPTSRLESVEEVLPVEISKHINGRSVIHLTQHTELITDIQDDDSVVPSKLLNVFSEDTVLTYENKFINTLVNRLYAFVAIRYNGAKECGEDEKNTVINLKQEFEHKEYNGKINVSIEISQKPEEHEVIKNYIYTSDVWKRMVRIYDICSEYMQSTFIKSMGRNFIRPPVLRTNTILKNPLFRTCLSLWEFIESYENTGYETLVQEDLLEASEKLIKDMYNSVAEQYVVFQTHIKNGFEGEKPLDSRLLNVHPLIKDEFDMPNDDEFNYKTLIPDIMKDEGPLEYPEDEIEFAILVALAADAMFWQDEIEEEETVIDEKGEIKYRYKYSYLARLIRAQLPTQDYYNEIKNHLLSYKGVKSLISWNRELFKQGNKKCCKLNCKGKTLFVYLPLNPKDYDENRYHHLDVSRDDKEVDYPFLLKVRSNRACKYAKELIDEVMAMYAIEKDMDYIAQDFHMEPMTIEQLLERDLARLIGEHGEEIVRPQEEMLPDDGFKYKYIYSFIAKLIRSGEDRQEFYNRIKNELLSYKTVKSRISWPRELFRSGLTKVCQLKVKGKTLCVYLPLDPDRFDYDHYHHEDIRVEGKENDFSLMIRIKSNLACKHAIELIGILMAELGLMKLDSYQETDYKFPYKTLEQMLDEDLARRVEDSHTEKPVEETSQNEETVTENEDTVIKDGIRYRYVYSYSARLIRSGDERQELYNLMKNEVLSYKKVTSKISWGHELFKLGRIKCCEFKIKGKTLCVYLPLDPTKYNQEHYHFIDNRKEDKEVQFPMIMKIKSNRAVKYCSELIADVMAMYGIPKLEEYESVDYKLPYMSVEDMLVSDPVLAKLVEDKTPRTETSSSEEITAPEEPVNEAQGIGEVPQTNNEDDDVVVKDGVTYRYKYSFSARLIRSGDERQDLYNQVKNNILSYKKVTSKISWGHELFKLGRIKLALLKVKGKTLCVYLPLNPDNYDQDRLHFKDMRVEGKEVEFPMMMKVKSDRAVKYVAELIADVMSNNSISKLDDYVEQDYRLPYMSVEDMLVSDPVLAKLVEDKTIAVNEETPAEEVPTEETQIESTENVEEQVAEEITSEPQVEETPVEANDELVEETSLEATNEVIEEPTEVVLTEENVIESSDEEQPVVVNAEAEHSSNLHEINFDGVEEANTVLLDIVHPKVINEVAEDNDEKDPIYSKYNYSFTARLIRAGMLRQDFYNDIKNDILSYKKVNSNVSWNHELFKLGRKKCALMKVKGKTLCVYLPLNPDNYNESRFHHIDCRVEGKEVEFPMLMKVKSDRGVGYVKELINDVMTMYEIAKDDTYAPINYRMKEISIEKMLSMNPPLVKLNDNEKHVEKVVIKKIEKTAPVIDDSLDEKLLNEINTVDIDINSFNEELLEASNTVDIDIIY